MKIYEPSETGGWYKIKDIKGFGICFWCLDRQIRYYDQYMANASGDDTELDPAILAGAPPLSEAGFIVDGTGFCLEHASAALRARQESTMPPAPPSALTDPGTGTRTGMASDGDDE